MGPRKGTADRSVHISGSVRSAVVQTGDGNVAHVADASITHRLGSLADDLRAFESLLTQFDSPRRTEIHDEFSAVRHELAQPAPDKARVASALGRALEYARMAQGFAKVAGEIGPPMMRVVHWLGDAGSKLWIDAGLPGK